jgi:hypothetical protein
MIVSCRVPFRRNTLGRISWQNKSLTTEFPAAEYRVPLRMSMCFNKSTATLSKSNRASKWVIALEIIPLLAMDLKKKDGKDCDSVQ